MENYETFVSILANKDGPKRLIIEPWAEEFAILETGKIELSIISDTSGSVQIGAGSYYLTVWLWRGCRVKVKINGVELVSASLEIAAPG